MDNKLENLYDRLYFEKLTEPIKESREKCAADPAHYENMAAEMGHDVNNWLEWVNGMNAARIAENMKVCDIAELLNIAQEKIKAKTEPPTENEQLILKADIYRDALLTIMELTPEEIFTHLKEMYYIDD